MSRINLAIAITIILILFIGISDACNIPANAVTEEIPLEASFTFSPWNPQVGEVVTFTESATGSNITSWAWTFGDEDSASIRSPTHAYVSAGPFLVILTVTDAAGATDTDTKSVIVTEAAVPLGASFSCTPISGEAPLTVSFTDESEGEPTSWEWNFGDDSALSTESSPTHEYTSDGEYTVTLTVTNDDGPDTKIQEDYITVTAPVTEKPPDADFTWTPTSPVVGSPVSFTDTSTGDGITEWKWDFDDSMDFSGNRESTLKNPQHTYEYAGSYTVTLFVKNSGGSDIILKTITVSPPPTPTPSPYRLSLNEGWNLASIPLINATYSVPPSVYSNVYSYDTVRQEYHDTNISEMQAGTGYWIASASNVNINLYGEPVSHYSCNGTKGWNMIGGLAYETTKNGITLDSMSISNSALYGYDGISRKYQSFGYLLPSRGYWLYLYEDGIVNVTMAPPSSPE